jgi:cytochrome c biogenesis factor
VQVGNTYTLSAFAKTRDLNSVARSYQNARYASGDNSSAKVGITWLNANGEAIGENRSEGINDTCDWTPLEVTAKAPEGATQAKAVLLTDCPNGHGISGSVWFDDVALR